MDVKKLVVLLLCLTFGDCYCAIHVLGKGNLARDFVPEFVVKAVNTARTIDPTRIHDTVIFRLGIAAKSKFLDEIVKKLSKQHVVKQFI